MRKMIPKNNPKRIAGGVYPGTACPEVVSYVVVVAVTVRVEVTVMVVVSIYNEDVADV